MNSAFTRRPTRKLFKQFHPDGTEDLNDWRAKFIEIGDPTEYQAAIALVGSWKEWCRFKKEWGAFSSIVDDWVCEVEIKLRSDAVRKLASMPDAGSQKWIAEGKYQVKKAGRPSKAQIEREAKIEAGVIKENDEEVDRVINAVFGNGTNKTAD